MLNGRNGVSKRMAFVVLALAIFNYIILNALRPGGLMAYVLPSACWGFLALVALKACGLGRIKSWFNGHITIAATSVAIFYVIVLVNIGFFMGFGESALSFTPRGLIINLTIVLTTLLGMEFSRAYLVKSFGRRRPFLTIGLVTLLYSFISISTVRLLALKDPLGMATFLGVGLLPVVAENLLASYLAFVGGPMASLAYRGPIMAFWWFCPVLPNLSWGVEALLGVMIPTVGFFVINMYTSPMTIRRLGVPVEGRGFGRARKSSVRGWVIAGVLCVFVVWASAGLLGIQPTTVISGSMSPAMEVGDMVIVRDVSADSIHPGTVIQFWSGEEMVIHRVVEASGEGDGRLFVTKGDANAEPDLELVSSSQVVGAVVLNIPKIGWASIAVKSFFSSAWSFLSANIVPVTFAIASGSFIFYIVRSNRRRSVRRWRGQGWGMRIGNGKLMAPLSLILVVMAVTGFAYSHWSETLYISGTVTTGTWGSCIGIRKTLEGSFTNPWTRENLAEPTNLIAIASEEFPTRFKLTIQVKNCGSTALENVIVTDCIELNVAPTEWTPSKGTVYWENVRPPGEPGEFIFNYLTWTIGGLASDELASLEIWIRTLYNPRCKYEPTSGDEGDNQELKINRGAKVVADSIFNGLSATTEGITIIIVDDNIPGNGIGTILTPLPYSTPWAEDRPPG